jgi:hypothetical protein
MEQLEVRPAKHAVSGYVGDHESGAASAVQPMQRLIEIAALPRPATRGELAAFDIQTDGDPLLVAINYLLTPLGALQRGGTDVHSSAPGSECPLQRVIIANAAGQLDIQPEVCDELGHDLGIVATAEGGIQVDQVNPLRAGFLPALGSSPGVPEPSLRTGLTLDQLHRLSSRDVDRRQEYEPVSPSAV